MNVFKVMEVVLEYAKSQKDHKRISNEYRVALENLIEALIAVIRFH